MYETHHIEVAHRIAAGLLLCATAYAFTRVAFTGEPRQAEISNHEFVVANMSADLESFGFCPRQAAMLAEQTADFGVLGLMTTVAAVGIDTGRPAPSSPVENESIGSKASRTAMHSATVL